MIAKPKLVYGVGVNDADYVVTQERWSKDSRKSMWTCPFYRTWKNMFERCYSKRFHARRPSYVGCSVCREWHNFSSFKAWMEAQDWEGKQLDKDILLPGNKVYSPDACAFVTQALNSFLTGISRSPGLLPVGVLWRASKGKYVARCTDVFAGRQREIGLFSSPSEAHQAWRKRKHELACQYADLQTDPRIAAALRARFAAPPEQGAE